MLSAAELEAAALVLDTHMRELQMRIMQDIVRRIRINGEITAAADWQIHRVQQLGMSKREIKKYIKEALELTNAEMNHLYKDVLRKGYARDESLYRFKGKPFIPFDENNGLLLFISAVSEQTANELENITRSMGFAIRQPDGSMRFSPIADYYQKTLDGAMLDISSGAFDYNTVLKRTVSEMVQGGICTVDYASGCKRNIVSAARTAVMTGMSQLTAKINEDNARALDSDKFEVTWHSGARPEHQVWQGKWYTHEQLVSVCGLGSVTGLCGANCYHDYYVVIDGISEPTYTKEELERMNKEENTPVYYAPTEKSYTKYEALQRQRRLENTMRKQRQKIKLLQEGYADESDILASRARYRGTSQEYTAFSEAMGLPQQRERVTADGLGDVRKFAKSIDISGRSGIIKKSGAISGALNHLSQRADEHAERYYAAVRKMTTDVKRISENTGYSEELIQSIKDFVFNEKHDLGDKFDYFVPDYKMAESWQRLIDGKDIKPHDLTLLKHEKMERELMASGYTQEEAHLITSKTYNYAKEAEEYYDQIKKHREK